jgi:hypothetical protein
MGTARERPAPAGGLRQDPSGIRVAEPVARVL